MKRHVFSVLCVCLQDKLRGGFYNKSYTGTYDGVLAHLKGPLRIIYITSGIACRVLVSESVELAPMSYISRRMASSRSLGVTRGGQTALWGISLRYN